MKSKARNWVELLLEIAAQAFWTLVIGVVVAFGVGIGLGWWMAQ